MWLKCMPVPRAEGRASPHGTHNPRRSRQSGAAESLYPSIEHLISDRDEVFGNDRRIRELEGSKCHKSSFDSKYGIFGNDRIELVEGKAMPDHVHMLLSVPLRYSLAMAVHYFPPGFRYNHRVILALPPDIGQTRPFIYTFAFPSAPTGFPGKENLCASAVLYTPDRSKLFRSNGQRP